MLGLNIKDAINVNIEEDLSANQSIWFSQVFPDTKEAFHLSMYILRIHLDWNYLICCAALELGQISIDTNVYLSANRIPNSMKASGWAWIVCLYPQ